MIQISLRLCELKVMHCDIEGSQELWEFYNC